MATQSEEMNKTILKCRRAFKENGFTLVLEISENILSEIKEFRPYVPLAVALRTTGLMKRHWEQIAEATQVEIKPNAALNLQKLMDMEFVSHLQICEQTALKAAKEYSIENDL